MVDDGKIFLSGALPVLEEVMPNATITGFTSPSEAVEYAKTNRVALAFLDIEMGKNSGFDLCRRLLALNPRTNVVYLTAYVEYSYDAWSTGASGFLLKPITPDGVRAQLKNLRYPRFRQGVRVIDGLVRVILLLTMQRYADIDSGWTLRCRRHAWNEPLEPTFFHSSFYRSFVSYGCFPRRFDCI